MSFDTETLYRLLPAIYRIRDAERDNQPLRELMDVIGEQVAVLEENLAQLYDDQFVETCAPWVLPYLGDLLGITGLPPAPIASRAEVANTIGYRRRKGTVQMLEQLARDIMVLPARAVEFFELLAATQYLNHLRLQNQSFVSLRSALELERLGGPFEQAAHTAEVRRIGKERGRYNIPNVGIFLWRLRAYPLTLSPASAVDARRFRVNPLGSDMACFSRPETEDECTRRTGPGNVADRLSRRALAAALSDYYGDGEDKSLAVYTSGTTEPVLVPPERITICDIADVTDGSGAITGWTHSPTAGVAIDPVRGRIFFAEDQATPPLVTFHYGFSADIGGGEYSRHEPLVEEFPTALSVSQQNPDPHATIGAALTALGTSSGVIEINDSGRYEEPFAINAAGRHIELRAGDQRRPLLVPPALVVIQGGENDEVTLSGLLIAGRTLAIRGALGRLRLRNCTLVPGLALREDGEPARPNQPSLIVESPNTVVEIDRCIVGGVRAVADSEVRVTNSIVDACAETGVAYAHPVADGPGGRLWIENSTVIGKVSAEVLEMASNTIFLAARGAGDDAALWRAPLQARRRQEGCIRFSFRPADSLVPGGYRCQPEGAADEARARPRLGSLRYGDPGYCQLTPHCPDEIRRGADDESEMGVFHDLFLPQREAHLRARLDEYLRFGLEAGIFYAT